MSIGQRIRTIRKQQGLSIDELAYRLGKNRTTIYRYENGDIENLPLGILDSLANALNTSPAYLMGWENSNSICHGLEPYDVTQTERLPKWVDEFGFDAFSDDDYKKIVEYAKFILSMRAK